MREIKFRGWDSHNEKMFDPGLILTGAKHVTLMQYTGLKDKNGVEIYEGDIVKYSYKSWGLGYETTVAVEYLTYHDAGYEDSWSGVGFNLNPGEHELGESLEEYEIIGNIYQNPELLEAK